MPIDQVAQSIPDRPATHTHEPDVEEHDCQRQAGQFLNVLQHRAFQVEAIFFQVPMHLFTPGEEPVILQGHAPIRQVGGQKPGFPFACLPMRQQLGRMDFLGRKIAGSQPEALACFLEKSTEGLPFVEPIQPYARIRFLAQDLPPRLLFQPFQHVHRAKFTVASTNTSAPAGKRLFT
jgi:hypothetical protein